MNQGSTCVLALISCSALSQNLPCITPAERASLIISQAAQSETLWFGYHALGTCAIDTVLCGENFPVPEPPFGVLSARWIPAGTGCIPHPDFDYRAFTTPADVDTYRVFMEPGISVTGVHFRWNPYDVGRMCDSALLLDEFGGTSFRKAMHTDSSAFLYMLAGPLGLLLIRFGQRFPSVVHAVGEFPTSARLFQNFPNPFNSGTTIEYSVPLSAGTSRSTGMSLLVFDVLGRRVATLIDGPAEPGNHSVRLDASNLPSGVYFYRLQAGSFVAHRKMMLVR